MKRLAMSVAWAALLAYPLLGQQEPAAESDSSTLKPTSIQVVKFMEAMQVRQRLQSSIQVQKEEVKTTVHNMFHKMLPDATPAQKEAFESVATSALRDIFTDYPFDDVLRDMIPIYQSHFSGLDLNEIVAFYSSPVGQKVLREMPAISAEAMRVSNARLQPKIDEVMKNLDARIRAMGDAESGKK